VHAADVGVGDLLGQAQLAAEALDRLLLVGEAGAHELEGDGLAEADVDGLVDVAHAARPDLLHQRVAVAEGLPGREAQGGGGAAGRSPQATSNTSTDVPTWIWSPGARVASSTARPFTNTCPWWLSRWRRQAERAGSGTRAACSRETVFSSMSTAQRAGSRPRRV